MLKYARLVFLFSILTTLISCSAVYYYQLEKPLYYYPLDNVKADILYEVLGMDRAIEISRGNIEDKEYIKENPGEIDYLKGHALDSANFHLVLQVFFNPRPRNSSFVTVAGQVIDNPSLILDSAFLDLDPGLPPQRFVGFVSPTKRRDGSLYIELLPIEISKNRKKDFQVILSFRVVDASGETVQIVSQKLLVKYRKRTYSPISPNY